MNLTRKVEELALGYFFNKRKEVKGQGNEGEQREKTEEVEHRPKEDGEALKDKSDGKKIYVKKENERSYKEKAQLISEKNEMEKDRNMTVVLLFWFIFAHEMHSRTLQRISI